MNTTNDYTNTHARKRGSGRLLLRRLIALTLCLAVLLAAPLLTQAAEPEIIKSETVYIEMEADGRLKSVIVNNWLQNRSQSDTIADESRLRELSITGADVSHHAEGERISWKANGKDIYYQGISYETPPINCRIRYKLNGKPIEPDELIGKSGRVTISVEYTNNIYKYETIQHERVRIYMPWTIAAYFTLNERFTNVTGENVRFMNEAGNTLVYAICFPGINKSLDLSGKNELPERFEITANVENFEFERISMMAFPDVFTQIDFQRLDEMLQLAQQLGEMADAADSLYDGAAQLHLGAESLSSGIGPYTQGVRELNGGIFELKQRMPELTEGVDTLHDATRQLDDGAQLLHEKTRDLNTDELETFSKTADDLLDRLQQASPALHSLRPVLEQLIQQDYDTSLLDAQMKANEKAIQALEALGDTQLELAIEQLKATNELLAELKLFIESSQQADDEELSGALDALYGLLDYVEEHSEELHEGLENLPGTLQDAQQGVAMLAQATQQLHRQVGGFKQDAQTLSEGVDQMYAGSSELAGYSYQLAGGAHTLCWGAGQLEEGLRLFSESLRKTVEENLLDVETLSLRKQLVEEYGKEYVNFSGIAPDMQGEIRLLLRTDELSLPPVPVAAEPQEPPNLWERIKSWLGL
ncbi:MAG: hypothetical protein ACOYJC_04685 [Christensenellales bacterium]|jgi:putative membrane protein